jgi:hypothetical protein
MRDVRHYFTKPLRFPRSFLTEAGYYLQRGGEFLLIFPVIMLVFPPPHAEQHLQKNRVAARRKGFAGGVHARVPGARFTNEPAGAVRLPHSQSQDSTPTRLRTQPVLGWGYALFILTEVPFLGDLVVHAGRQLQGLLNPLCALVPYAK